MGSISQKNAPIAQLSKSAFPWLGPPPAPAKLAAGERSFLLQRWLTVRGNASAPNAVTSIVQDDIDWLDLSRFAEAAFWVEVSGLTTNGSILLTLESSPTTDSTDFKPCTAPLTLAPSADSGGNVVPILVKTIRTPSTAPLARYTRWKLTATGATGAWDVSFRIRGVGGRTSYFLPTDIPGCNLWLRTDLGVTLSSGSITNWSDQSGTGNHAASARGNPSYSTSGGVMGLPRIIQSGGNEHLRGTFASSIVNHTLFAVVTYPNASNHAAYAGTLDSNYAVNSAFQQFVESGFPLNKVIARSCVTGFGLYDAITTDTSSLTKVGIYSMSYNGTTTDLFVNGVSKATVNPVGTQNAAATFVLMALDSPLVANVQYPLTGDAYEYILYNRAITAAERIQVHRYLGARYGVVVP